MISEQKGSKIFRLFKWRGQAETSLSTGLLDEVYPEIELSAYGRIPSPGSESPSRLLNGESLTVDPIPDLDLFFERLYNYYSEKGLWCIIIKWVVELLSLGFTICFSGFFLLYVDWNGLRNVKCGMDAVESGIKPCDLAKEALHRHPLTPFTISTAIIVGYLAVFTVYWIFCFLRFFAQLRDTLGTRHFYYDRLHVTDNEIHTMSWASVIEKIVQLQRSERLCVVKDLSAHDIVMRLMRKENYLIGMLNKGVLAFPISKWVPGAGPTVKYGPNGKRYRLILTKTLEWTLNWCILQSMFDRNFCVRRDFIYNPNALKKRLVIVGLVMLLLSPFLVIFMLVYPFLRHAEQFYNHPSTASSRRWSNLSKWMFREFNEVDHLFRHRINSSVLHASEYLKQFPSPIISIIAKFISFVSGGFAAILIIIAFLEESLLEGHIFGHNLIWYAAVFGTITAISRAAVPEELLVLDPEGAMSLVVQHTHYMPKKWRGKENTEMVRLEFEALFQYTGMMLVEEMASIFLTPYLLLFLVPKRVDDILKFISDYTVDIEGVGHVCSFSAFDFQNHGSSNYGSPFNTSRAQRSSQGKMEKSFLCFQTSYPSWEPDEQGKQFMSTLRRFREQKLQGHLTTNAQAYSPPETWRRNQNFRNQQAGKSIFFSRETHHNNPRFGDQFDSLWFIDADQRNHPYLLDWYYTSKPHDDVPGNTPADVNDIAEERPDDIWMPGNFTPNEAMREEFWRDHINDGLHNDLEASTSHPGSLHHQDASNMANSTRSHWWARNVARGNNDQPPQAASFLEPPSHFNFHAPANYLENLSERPSVEEQDQDHDQEQDQDQEHEHEHDEGEGEHLGWRYPHHLSKTTFMDDYDPHGDDLDLHFGDVYSRPAPLDLPGSDHSSTKFPY